MGGATTTTTHYVVDAELPYAQVLLETDGAHQVTAKYTYADDLLKVSRNGEYYYFTDGLGSTRLMTDATGVIVNRYTYDAYGTQLPAECEATVANEYRFTGERTDADTGLVYLRARYYDPTTGRFVQRDSYTGSTYDPASLHRYGYCHGNPVNATDPSGHFTFGQYMTATAIGVTLGGTIGATYGYIKEGVSGAVKYGVAGAVLGGMMAPAILASGTLTAGLLTRVGITTVGRFAITEKLMAYLIGTSINLEGMYRSGNEALNGPTWRDRAAGAFAFAVSLFAQAFATRVMLEDGTLPSYRSKWVNADGSIKWPPNDGFDGPRIQTTLSPGTRIDRYGFEGGYCTSPEGTPYVHRALAPGTELKPYHVYEVVRPVEVDSGTVAPWFDQPGGGIQYQFSQKIISLVNAGVLKRIK